MFSSTSQQLWLDKLVATTSKSWMLAEYERQQQLEEEPSRLDLLVTLNGFENVKYLRHVNTTSGIDDQEKRSRAAELRRTRHYCVHQTIFSEQMLDQKLLSISKFVQMFNTRDFVRIAKKLNSLLRTRAAPVEEAREQAQQFQNQWKIVYDMLDNYSIGRLKIVARKEFAEAWKTALFRIRSIFFADTPRGRDPDATDRKDARRAWNVVFGMLDMRSLLKLEIVARRFEGAWSEGMEERSNDNFFEIMYAKVKNKTENAVDIQRFERLGGKDLARTVPVCLELIKANEIQTRDVGFRLLESLSSQNELATALTHGVCVTIIENLIHETPGVRLVALDILLVRKTEDNVDQESFIPREGPFLNAILSKWEWLVSNLVSLTNDDDPYEDADNTGRILLFVIVHIVAHREEPLTSEALSLILKGLKDVGGNAFERLYDKIDADGSKYFGPAVLLGVFRAMKNSPDAIMNADITLLCHHCALPSSAFARCSPQMANVVSWERSMASTLVFDYIESQSHDTFGRHAEDIFILTTVHFESKQRGRLVQVITRFRKHSETPQTLQSTAAAAALWIEAIKGCTSTAFKAFVSFFVTERHRTTVPYLKEVVTMLLKENLRGKEFQDVFPLDPDMVGQIFKPHLKHNRSWTNDLLRDPATCVWRGLKPASEKLVTLSGDDREEEELILHVRCEAILAGIVALSEPGKSHSGAVSQPWQVCPKDRKDRVVPRIRLLRDLVWRISERMNGQMDSASPTFLPLFQACTMLTGSLGHATDRADLSVLRLLQFLPPVVFTAENARRLIATLDRPSHPMVHIAALRTVRNLGSDFVSLQAGRLRTIMDQQPENAGIRIRRMQDERRSIWEPGVIRIVRNMLAELNVPGRTWASSFECRELLLDGQTTFNDLWGGKSEVESGSSSNVHEKHSEPEVTRGPKRRSSDKSDDEEDKHEKRSEQLKRTGFFGWLGTVKWGPLLMIILMFLGGGLWLYDFSVVAVVVQVVVVVVVVQVVLLLRQSQMGIFGTPLPPSSQRGPKMRP
jgi:hypothetical protein